MNGWIWLGEAAHYICGPWCRWHLATVVGPWLVSSVGEYVPRNGDRAGSDIETIGADRFYETMVFRAKRCECGERGCAGWRIANGNNVDFAAANTAAEASANHMAMLNKWSGKTLSDVEAQP